MKTCGTCKWFAPYGDFAPGKGTCAFPLPVWLRDDISSLGEHAGPSPMSANVENLCDTWTDKDIQEFNPEQVVLKSQPGKLAVFVMQIEDDSYRHLSTTLEYWKLVWQQAGYSDAETPILMIVANGVSVQPLTDADMEAAGLMRIPVQN